MSYFHINEAIFYWLHCLSGRTYSIFLRMLILSLFLSSVLLARFPSLREDDFSPHVVSLFSVGGGERVNYHHQPVVPFLAKPFFIIPCKDADLYKRRHKIRINKK